MRSRSKYPLLILVPLLLAVWAVAYAVASDGVSFADAALEEAILEQIDGDVEMTTLDALAQIDELRVRDAGIQELEGIQYLTGLVSLDLRGNDIEDIGLLAQLLNLENLNLRDNQITDISPLESLTSLKELNIRGNNIADISALSFLHELEDLNLRYNDVEDIEPLRDLPHLRTRLYLDGNPVTDYSPVAEYYQEIEEIDFDSLPPRFSVEGGFYEDEITLELSTDYPDAEIYYTLDGSEPNRDAKQYTTPITITSRAGEPNRIANIMTSHVNWKQPGDDIFKATVVRAVAYKEDSTTTDVVTHTYFIDENIQERYSLPVVSIATNEENLFDDEIGIYVPGNLYENIEPEMPWRNPGNYFESGREWERPISFEFYEEDGQIGFSQNMGVRIHGGITRHYPQKSLRLYPRNDYGQSRINYQLFPDKDLDDFNRVMLRNSGNDWNDTLFRDAMLQSLVEHTELDTQSYRPVIVFINGEYWGIHNIRERFDKHYLETNYGVDPDNIDFLENDQVVNEGDNTHYSDMLQFIINNDMSVASNYEYIKTQMDIDNFIHYQIAHIFFRNTDWPHNNIRYWRLKTDYDPDAEYGHDGRWRWFLYDTDHGFGYTGGEDSYSHNTLEWATREDEWSTELIRGLLENQEFRNQFINQFANHLNTSFESERVIERIDSMQAVIEPEIENHIERWSHPSSTDEWEANVEVMREFAQERPGYVREHVMHQFDLDGVAKLEIQTEHSQAGDVLVNRLKIENDEQTWSGQYFQGVPIEIQAVPTEGYRFKGWSGDIIDEMETIQLSLDADTQLTPIFEKE